MISLGAKIRPSRWEDVLGQSTIIETLKRQVENKTIKNSLFSGASGCGKTTVARLVCNYLHAELVEIDAASNNGVDNIRALTSISYEKSISNEYKVIILDEAHMLTTQSWNALLKTLEEPSPYTIFILCTTEPQKIPETILNRVQRFNFSKIPQNLILERLSFICKEENINIDEESLYYIANRANGSVREALSLLDQVSIFKENLTLDLTLKVLGGYDENILFSLTDSLLDGKEASVLNILDNYYDKGGDLNLLINDYLAFCLDIVKYIIFKDISLTKFSKLKENLVINIINFDNPENYYNYIIDKLIKSKQLIKDSLDIKTIVEIIFLQIARCK